MTEFGFIEHIRTSFASLPDNGFEGIGDDCAVLPVGTDAEGREEVLLFTADLLTEGVHFLRRATPARELGRKALAVNLSDIAAMGSGPCPTAASGRNFRQASVCSRYVPKRCARQHFRPDVLRALEI